MHKSPPADVTINKATHILAFFSHTRGAEEEIRLSPNSHQHQKHEGTSSSFSLITLGPPTTHLFCVDSVQLA